MTGIRQPHHFQPIPAEEAEDAKPWRLPFWTEPPAWLVEKEQQEKAQQQEAAEESGESLPLPTAEELENIRRDAYNDGLEQGLIEGRQQGLKDGYDDGQKEGYQAAFEQGQKEGREQGFKSGEEDGRRKGQADINAVVQRLQRVINTLQAEISSRDRQLPDVLAGLVTQICQRVLQTELAEGALSIHQFVRRALDELPAGEDNVRVFVGPDDARHLRNSLEMTGDELHFSVDDKLPAGSCRVESEHSLVEYSAQENLSQLLDHIQPQLLQAAASFPDEREQLEWDAPTAADPTADTVADTSADTMTDASAEMASDVTSGDDQRAPESAADDDDPLAFSGMADTDADKPEADFLSGDDTDSDAQDKRGATGDEPE